MPTISLTIFIMHKGLSIAKTLFLYLLLINCCHLIPRTNGIILSSFTKTVDLDENGSCERWTPSVFPTAAASNISEQCSLHTKEYMAALRNQVPWAIESNDIFFKILVRINRICFTVYESSGRLIEDLVYTGSGNIHHESGLFDECLSIQSNDMPFRGQYCTVFFDLKPTKNSISESKEAEPDDTMTSFRMPSVSFCIPSTCSASDLRSAVAQRVGYRVVNGINHTIVTISSEEYCHTKHKINVNNITTDNVALITLY